MFSLIIHGLLSQMLAEPRAKLTYGSLVKRYLNPDVPGQLLAMS